LRPEDDRLLREMIDEIAWLLGVQFTIQAIAAAGTEASTVLAGAADAVLRRGKQLLGEQWQLELEFRPEIVVAAVDFDAAGHGWQQVGHALAMARNLVAQGGKIIILSELADQPGCGLETIRNSESPRDALKPLRLEAPSDLLTATELAHATDWATVYLLSRLEGDLLEELFLVPLESEREVQRLLSGEEKCAFVGSAQHTHGRVSS
jgi:hypothetical protein